MVIDPGSPKINDTDRDSQGATPPWPHFPRTCVQGNLRSGFTFPKRRKAERDANEAEVKTKSTEPAAQDEQVSTEAAEEEDLRSESKAERILEKQAQATESTKASEGGADVGEPPAADRVSDSPQPEQDEGTAKDVPVKVKAEVIAEVSSRSPQSSSNQAPSSSQTQAPEPEVLPRGDASNPVPAP
ncbi:unnamed protein product [Phytophthora fragariaefolia]|uniref:Unnamed protein product n=1 Tax=Phytophthora fragariaefolia TaxID=1490495 RepID=A0A9W6YNI4_9STRA|nr:unnamed protein product [Phytophthora fragariaefolia]